VEDAAEIGLHFSGGTIGSVHLDYNQQPGAHHLEIVGCDGTLTWDNATGLLRRYVPGKKDWEDFPTPEGFERNALFLEEMGHFIRVVRGEETPLCTLDDGRRALELVLAALRSSREGKMIELEKE